MRTEPPIPRGSVTQRLCLFALLLLGACARWPPPAPPRETNLGLSISTTTLANGLRVIVVIDPKATEVQVTTRYQVGAVDDEDQPGMAHLVEHLMFQQILDGQSVFAHLEDVATQFNALTTLDATTFITRAPPPALDKLLAIEALRLEARCGNLPEAAFAREREVVLNELRQKDQSTQILAAVHAALYPEGHPYRRPVGGTLESVGAITREQACAFADAHYAPDKAVLVISGNLSAGTIETSLGALRTRIAKRTGKRSHPVPSATVRPQHLDVPAPIDEDLLVLAWPLPTHPVVQSAVRAIGSYLVSSIDDEIKGRVVALEFGDTRAPMLGLVVLPDAAETFQQAIDGTRRGISNLPDVFQSRQSMDVDQVLFERLKHSAIYRVYAALEDGSSRDIRLATHLLAGRDPNEAIDSELAALRALTRDQGARLAMRYLASNSPTVLTLQATPGPKRGARLTLRAPVHDLGPRRTPPDPARAHQPADQVATPMPDGVRTSVLPNGLRVVLLPQTSTPTFDARLVFRVGTADEQVHKRGVATVAAHTLSWDPRYLDDLFAFTRAGGMTSTDVSTDRTTFAVQGIDAHLDIVLAGLRRWVREGSFDDSAEDFMAALRRAAKRVDDQGALTDAWRAALFGEGHPYVHAGIARHANTNLTFFDAAAFRAAYYTPDNATLVIAGRFDPDLAERWIEFLFADWEGSTRKRTTPRAISRPVSLASIDDIAMVQVRMALPGGAPSLTRRAHQLVAAAMLNDIASDVRHQLGASYAFGAQLAETRAGSYYLLSGWIDAGRSTDAVRLVRDRIHALHTDPAAAAAAFVTARDHVLVQLRSQAGTTATLASRIEAEIELGRAPMSTLETAAAVQGLTLEAMQPTLAELNLYRATVLLHGPEPEVKAAFDVLGRTPHLVERIGQRTTPGAPPSHAPSEVPRPFGHAQHLAPFFVRERALTQQPPYPRRILTLTAGMSWMRLEQTVGTTMFRGPSLAARIGTRTSWSQGIGLHLGLAQLENLDGDAVRASTPAELLPVDLLAFWHLDVGTRGWLDGLLGVRFERVTAATSQWRNRPRLAAELGVDVVRHGDHRIGASAGIGLADDHLTLSLGLVYRQ